MKQAASKTLCLLLCTALAGCGGAIQNAEREATHNEQGSLSIVWSRTVGSQMSPFAEPGGFGNVLCTIASNGEAHFTAFDGSRPIPSTTLPASANPYFATAGCEPTTIAAIDKDGTLTVANQQGQLVWRKDLRTGVVAPPIVVGRRLLTLGLDGRLNAFAVRQGKPLWSYLSPLRNTLRTAVPSKPLIINRTIYTGLNNASLVAVDLVNGKIIWENIIALPLHSNVINNIQDTTSPAGNERIVCAAAYQGGVACFDARNGERYWNQSMSVDTAVALDEDGSRLFASDQDGTLYAFNAYTGEQLWKVKTEDNLSTPAAVQGAVVVGNDNGILTAYDAATGERITHIGTNSNTFTSLQRLPNSSSDFIALTQAGSLFRISFKQ